MYKLTENGVIRLSDGAFIPNDPANKDWQEYQEWLKQGNQPLPQYTPQELRQKLQSEMLSLRLQRINQVIVQQYGYDDLADVQTYLNDPNLQTECQALIKWYLAYDDLVWNWIDNTLPTIPDADLETIDIKTVETDLFNQSIQKSPLP